MAKSDRAGMPEGPKRPLLSLLRESGDALEAASPPFDAAAAASRLREAAAAYGFLRAEGIPEDDRAVTGAELEEEAPPFDVETGAARLREAARARGLLPSASEHSAQRTAGLGPQMPGKLTGRSERTGQSMSGQIACGQFGIGEVLAQLRPEFPDISTSKIRFLEAKGLIEPARSRSGYRRFSAGDIDRLRYILAMQRDSYLPLQVIRERLAGGLRIAVVGIGNSGSRHVRVLRSATGVAAIAGVDQRFSKTGNAGQEIDHGVTAYSCVEDALPNVDAVIIATPPASHAPLGLQAIEAGKHVLIEQPMATTTEAARHLIDAANSARVLLMPGHTFEHNPAIHKLREIVSTGQLGRPFYLNCERLNPGHYQTAVNAIFALAPHDISISNFLLGAQPTTVTAWAAQHAFPEYDGAYVRLDYADLGVMTTIHLSWLSPAVRLTMVDHNDQVHRIAAVGSQKMVVYHDTADGHRIRVHDTPPSKAHELLSQAASVGEVVPPLVASAEPLAVQDQHFIDCIINGSRPSVDGSSGLAVVQALESAHISLHKQRTAAPAEATPPKAVEPGHLPDGMSTRGIRPAR